MQPQTDIRPGTVVVHWPLQVTRRRQRFDIRAFHERVLAHGAITLPMAREVVTRWIAEKKSERWRRQWGKS